MATKQSTKAKATKTKATIYDVVVPLHTIELFNLKAKNKKEAKENAIKMVRDMFRQSIMGDSAVIKGKVVVTKK